MSTFFRITCPKCKRTLKVSQDLVGKTRACPHCGTAVRFQDRTPVETANAVTPERITPAPGAASGAVSNSDRVRPPQRTASPTRGGSMPLKRRWFKASGESADTDVSPVLSGLIGAAATVALYVATVPLIGTTAGDLFWRRGPVPFPTTLLMFWAIAILVLKWNRLRKQRSAMLLDVLPTEISPEITFDSIDAFVDHINSLPGAGTDSFLINRVVRGIEHFRVRKSAADTVTMMESQSEIDANNVAGSYTIVKVFIWALPILGFIGTVMGVSSAVASLAGSLSGGGSMEAMKAALQEVFAGLGTAFDTTLLALIMSMIVKVPTSALQKSEEDLITKVDEYCNENLLRRLNDGREGGAQRTFNGGGMEKDGINGDAERFRDVIEQSLANHHAESKRFLERLDEVGETLVGQINRGWDDVNDRIEDQQRRHVEELFRQHEERQQVLHQQVQRITDAADTLQQTLTRLSEQSDTLHGRIAETFDAAERTLEDRLTEVGGGLSALADVLERLGEQQVIVQRVEPPRGWFAKRRARHDAAASNGR